jgi:hypothetical protein
MGVEFGLTGCSFLGAGRVFSSSRAILSFPVVVIDAGKQKKNYEYHITHSPTWHSASHRQYPAAVAAH